MVDKRVSHFQIPLIGSLDVSYVEIKLQQPIITRTLEAFWHTFRTFCRQGLLYNSYKGYSFFKKTFK